MSKASGVELPGTFEGDLSQDLVMKDMESQLTILCNQARLPMVHLGHQPIHKALDPYSALIARCADAMVAQRNSSSFSSDDSDQ